MRISKTGMVLLSLLVTLMLLSLPFLLPSGAITSQANRAYLDAAAGEAEEDFADGAFGASLQGPNWDALKPAAVLASSGMSDILPVNDISALPLDNSPGRAPIEANFTDNGYRDDTIIVEMERLRQFDSDVSVARVKIATASQLRTAYAGSKIDSDRTNQPSRIAKNYNAVAAINGDYYPKTLAGYIVRQGEVYREKTSKNMDLLLIDEWGDFHIIRYGHDNQKEGVAAFKAEHEITNGFFFGPALVHDGEVLEIPKHYQFDPFSPNPRAAIGQTGPLTYVMVTVNGRTDSSTGVTLAQLAQIMGDLGCTQAYNLDGGNSATLVFHGDVYNDKPQSERDVTDIIYFASATQSE
ncbi:MAG: phosphodiester glycosidase family protein [Candidatus Limiplasma sp.]|nr:phosphodiester glycosidase family protein [Candidatus Limiplasma sp.]